MSLYCKERIEKRRVLPVTSSVGVLARCLLGAIMLPQQNADYICGQIMTEQPSTLYAKLLGETAPINWQQLQPFFARGALLLVGAGQDLIAVAEAVAQNDQDQVSAWLAAGQLRRVDDDCAADLLQRDPQLWAVVVAPWVLTQERAAAPVLH
jgi:hypothetical protein